MSGGYAYFETSYKAANRVFSSAALESGSGDMKIQVMDDLNGVAGSNYSSSISSASAPSLLPTNGVFKQSYSVSSLEDVVSVVPNTAHLISPNISVTGPKGICLNFYYNLDGLSAEKLRILVRGIESESNQTLWESATESEGKWMKASVAYAYETTHQVNILTLDAALLKHVCPADLKLSHNETQSRLWHLPYFNLPLSQRFRLMPACSDKIWKGGHDCTFTDSCYYGKRERLP